MLNVSISAILPMTGSWQHTVARQQKGAQNVTPGKMNDICRLGNTSVWFNRGCTCEIWGLLSQISHKIVNYLILGIINSI